MSSKFELRFALCLGMRVCSISFLLSTFNFVHAARCKDYRGVSQVGGIVHHGTRYFECVKSPGSTAYFKWRGCITSFCGNDEYRIGDGKQILNTTFYGRTDEYNQAIPNKDNINARVYIEATCHRDGTTDLICLLAENPSENRYEAPEMTLALYKTLIRVPVGGNILYNGTSKGELFRFYCDLYGEGAMFFRLVEQQLRHAVQIKQLMKTGRPGSSPAPCYGIYPTRICTDCSPPA